MRFSFVPFVILLIALPRGAATAGDYTLTVNGRDYEMELGKETVLEMGAGCTATVILDRKPVSTFRSEGFVFDHPSGLLPSRKRLGVGLHQTMMASPVGTLVIIQEYDGIDPSALVDMMLRELTKEETEYGYSFRKTDAARTLADGTVLTGVQAVSTYKDTEMTREVLCYSGRDSGLLVITAFDREYSDEAEEIIGLFWKTLRIVPG